MQATMTNEESEFIVDQSERDAERVYRFLSAIGIKQIWKLPVIFLMDLAAALRLIYWEMKGFKFHKNAGLPDGSEALYNVLFPGSEEDLPQSPLMPKVLELSLQHLTWSGRSATGADLSIACDEDKLIDAIARFCVKYRHSESHHNFNETPQETNHGKKT